MSLVAYRPAEEVCINGCLVRAGCASFVLCLRSSRLPAFNRGLWLTHSCVSILAPLVSLWGLCVRCRAYCKQPLRAVWLVTLPSSRSCVSDGSEAFLHRVLCYAVNKTAA
nr:uncharacterized protein LOC129454696 isoform X2 [Misgurnus anguillicaudatus]